MDLYNHLSPNDILSAVENQQSLTIEKVNGHFHTPYSFSAFTEIKQVMDMAEAEHVSVLGINDFYSMDGYEEFASLCSNYKKYPLFNVEFMGLLKEEQAKGIRVNDPNNPGRTYLSGKGLDYPVSLRGPMLDKLQSVRQESDKQTRKMVQKASDHMAQTDTELTMNYEDIRTRFTKGMVRERHIAMAIRSLVFEKYKENSERIKILSSLYGGSESTAELSDSAAIDGEIRGKLLKAGGPAFVKEDPKAFLEIQEVIEIIHAAGGIPCYPVLLDDAKGNITEFEANMQELHDNLTSLKVFSLELIPGRNKMKYLKPFVEFFDQKDFLITFGTEHNTPVLEPLTVRAGDAELDEYLLKVGYEGACVIAAHQYLRSAGANGYLDHTGKPGKKSTFVAVGNAVIQQFIK